MSLCLGGGDLDYIIRTETKGRMADWDQGDLETISYPLRDLEVGNNKMVIINI